MKPFRQTYEQQAEQFAKVCDVAIEVLANADIPADEKRRMLGISRADKQMALHPQPMYKKVASLKCLEAEHFWYWNEHNGAHIDKFWQEIKRLGLGYERKDIFQKIFKQRKIANRIEYDYVLDEMLVAEQTGRITSEELKRLNNYLLAYEKPGSKSKMDKSV